MYVDSCVVPVQGLLLWVIVQNQVWVDDFGSSLVLGFLVLWMSFHKLSSS